MKKIIFLLSMMLPLVAGAYDFALDDIYYDIKGKEVTVTYANTSYGSYSGDVVIPETVDYNGKTFQVTRIGAWAFYESSSLNSVIIPSSVTIIEGQAFNLCSNLVKVVLPNSLKEIEDGAFYRCETLWDINIPNSVVNIGADAFYNTAWYNNQADGLIYAGLVAYKYKGNMPDGSIVEIADGTLGIAGSAFMSCQGLTKVLIPNTVEYIGRSAFGACENLIEAIIPNSVIEIDDGAFAGCKSLNDISIPESVTSMGMDVFYNTAWYNNKPNGLVYAGLVAYKYKGNMPSYTSIKIKDGTIAIAGGAFAYCDNLMSIDIPNSVTFIGDAAFSHCI